MEKNATTENRRRLWAGAIAALVVVAVAVAVALWMRDERATSDERAGVADAHVEEVREVELSPELLAAARLEIESVTERQTGGLLRVTGTVELNQEQTQQATPLVSGRVERVAVGLGDRVRAGAVLAVIASPEIAQMHGKLHEAETRVALAERNLDRVLKAENRAAVLSAKARLDEAEATLARTRKLVSAGVSAGADLVAADTAYRTAKAEYDFQSNIALNKEVAESRAELETARVDASHIRHEMEALGADVPEDHGESHAGNTALVALRAPNSGTVTERLVNVGAGVEAGRPLFTIGNISTVWVVANVPEGQVGRLRVGAQAEIGGLGVGAGRLAGRINYIDPQLDESTRTARVRVDVPNPDERLKAGMFVDVGFQADAAGGSPEELALVVPSEAIQRVGDRTVVFVPRDDEPGHFEVRDVEIGGEVDGYRRVISGLGLGERVVTKGGFTLKTQMMKGEMGEHDH